MSALANFDKGARVLDAACSRILNGARGCSARGWANYSVPVVGRSSAGELSLDACNSGSATTGSLSFAASCGCTALEVAGSSVDGVVVVAVSVSGMAS